MRLLHLVAALSLALATPVLAQEEAIGVPGPIVFEGTSFALAWTSHPLENYYKQEYVPAGQAVESYAEMFMVDVLTEGPTPHETVAAFAAQLDERKATDPLVNYNILENPDTGEVLFDFLLSDTSSGTMIVEWNAYRYSPLGDGTSLFAISRRGYDEDGATEFLTQLPEWRQASINALAKLELPEISIQD